MCHPHCSEISSALSKIPFVSVAVVNKSTPLLEAVFDSCAFPSSNGNTIFTVMMGGRWFSATLGDDPSVARVEELAVEHLQRIIRHDKAPVRYVFHVQSHLKK